jgi:histidine triad (HIT) family protein
MRIISSFARTANQRQPSRSARRSRSLTRLGATEKMRLRVGCDVCSEIAGEIAVPGGMLCESALVLVFHVPPLLKPTPMLGHMLVVPRRHADTWADLTDAEASEIGATAARLARALRELTGAERVYSAVVGHHAPHFHLHLFPRYPGTPPEFEFLSVDEWSGTPKGGAAEIAAFVEDVRRRV